MATSLVRKFLLAAVLLLLSAVQVHAADKGTPSQAYLDFKSAAEKAAALDEVLPFLSSEYRAMLESRPKEDHPVWLSRLKDSANKSEVSIGKETISGEKATLEAVAKDADGAPLKGKISLVKEAGGWKLDEQGWATAGLPPR